LHTSTVVRVAHRRRHTLDVACCVARMHGVRRRVADWHSRIRIEGLHTVCCVHVVEDSLQGVHSVGRCVAITGGNDTVADPSCNAFTHSWRPGIAVMRPWRWWKQRQWRRLWKRRQRLGFGLWRLAGICVLRTGFRRRLGLG